MKGEEIEEEGRGSKRRRVKEERGGNWKSREEERKGNRKRGERRQGREGKRKLVKKSLRKNIHEILSAPFIDIRGRENSCLF